MRLSTFEPISPCLVEVLDHVRMHDAHINAAEIKHVFKVLGAAFADDRNDTKLRFALKNCRDVVGGVEKTTVGVAGNNCDNVPVGFLAQPRVQAQRVLVCAEALPQDVAEVMQSGPGSVDIETRAE